VANINVETHTYGDNDEKTEYRLIREEAHDGKTVYICTCGLGYDDPLIAFACYEYTRTHGTTSEDIIKRAVYNPRSDKLAKRAITTP
jgi:hypothetical protein